MTGLDAIKAATWLNPPPALDRTAQALGVETGARTDFRRDTLYGFRRDRGHAFMVPVAGDSTAHGGFDGTCEALCDQAGLMLRQDESHCIKAGIELSDGVANLSAVVTHGASERSTLALCPTTGPQRLRLTRVGGAAVIRARNDATCWQLWPVTPFPEGPLRIGPMACSPERGEFRARFAEFTLGPAVAKALHDEGAAT